MLSAVVLASVCLLSESIGRTSCRKPPAVLAAIAEHAVDWDVSSTPAPISTATVLAKLEFREADRRVALSSAGVYESKLEDVPITKARSEVNKRIRRSVREACAHGCDPNEADPDFGLAPLHWASLFGDEELTALLQHHGAVPTPDVAQRLPANLSYSAFSSNSKKWAAAAGRQCEFPIVQLPTRGTTDSEQSRSANYFLNYCHSNLSISRQARHRSATRPSPVHCTCLTDICFYLQTRGVGDTAACNGRRTYYDSECDSVA